MTKDGYQAEFRKQLAFKNNVYNIMALCISYIMITKKVDFRKFNSKKYKKERLCVQEYRRDREAFGEGVALSNFKHNLEEIFDKDVDVEHYYAIVYFMDEIIPPKNPVKYVNGEQFIEYESLNSELIDKVLILPYYKETKYENAINKVIDGNMVFRARREYNASPIGKFLSQYIIFDQNAIKKYPVKMYYVPKETFFGQKLCEKSSILVKMFPLLNKEMDKVLKYKCKSNTFKITGFCKLAKGILKKRNVEIREEIEEGTDVDFIVLPEMLSDAQMDCNLYNSENVNNAFFLINGSKWKNRKNSSKVMFFDRNKKAEFEYNKKSCFEFKKNGNVYAEDIDLQETNYLVWDIEDFGRISICICCDLIEENIKQFHMLMRTNLLFVPAYTSSMDLLSAAEALSKDYKCIVIVANSCSAVASKDDDRICFVTMPGKESTNREVKKYFVRHKACWEKCVKSKCGIVLNIHLDEYCFDEDNICSFKIIEIND